jgi:hypothetical protein
VSVLVGSAEQMAAPYGFNVPGHHIPSGGADLVAGIEVRLT